MSHAPEKAAWLKWLGHVSKCSHVLYARVLTLTTDIHSHVVFMSHREAARECRRKKKEYVKCLENRVAVLENQNKTLIEELKALKDLYCHKSE